MSRIKNLDYVICGSSSLKRARSSAFLAAAKRIKAMEMAGAAEVAAKGIGAETGN
jgi:hypothetical protein